MPYSDKLLASGESIKRREHQHPFVLVWNARWAIAGLVLALVLILVRVWSAGSGPVMDLLGFLALALFVGGLAWLGWSYLRYQNEEYVITTRRLIHAEGVINKKSTDSSLEKINDAVYTQTWLGRIFGFGDLDVLTASETGIDRLKMLIDANEFKKAMLEAKHELELEYTRPVSPPLRVAAEGTAGAAPVGTAPAAQAPSAAATSADEVTDALARLADLRDRGAITPEDYERKKDELLARL